jgi:hypothetical protein
MICEHTWEFWVHTMASQILEASKSQNSMQQRQYQVYMFDIHTDLAAYTIDSYKKVQQHEILRTEKISHR